MPYNDLKRRVAAGFLAALFCIGTGASPAFADETKPVDLSVVQTDAPDPVLENGFVTYVVVVTNAGPQPANSIFISPSVSAGSFVSGTGHRWVCDLDGLVRSCDHKGALPAGSSSDPLRIVVQAPSSSVASHIDHSVTVSTRYPEYIDQDLSNNSATERTKINPGADMTVDQVDEPDPVTAGNTVRYLITANNNSNAVAATGVSVALTPSSGSITSVDGTGWSCAGTSSSATCSFGGTLAPNTAAPMVELQVLTGFSSVNYAINNKAVVSSSTGDTNGANNTDYEPTTVSAGQDGSAIGYIDPSGGQVTTCQPGEPSQDDNACTTVVLPAGPGGVATLEEGPQLDICAQVGCTGGSVDVIIPPGYDQGVTGPASVRLYIDGSISDPADDPTREIYVQKIVQGGELETFVIPSCAAPIPGLPCVRSQERLLDGDYLGTVEMFSGDPIFEVGDGLTAPG